MTTHQEPVELRKLAEAARKTLNDLADMTHKEFRECDFLRGKFRREAPSKVIELLDALQSQSERVKELEATNKECVRCLGEALQEATDCHAALQSEDELPEPGLLRGLVPYRSPTEPGRVEDGYTAEQLRQAQAKVRAKMVPLTSDQIHDLAEPFGCFEFGDAQGAKRRVFVRAIEAAHGITGEPK